MKRLTFLYVLFFTCTVASTSTAAETAKTPLAEMEALRQAIEDNTSPLPKDLGQKRQPEDKVKAANVVVESADKVLVNDDITDEFRIWTLKRKAMALIVLSYEETSKNFGKLAGVIKAMEKEKKCEKVVREAEWHLLMVGSQLTMQRTDGGVKIDVQALAQRMVIFAKQYPSEEADNMLEHFIYNIYQMKPLSVRDRQLAVTAPIFQEYFSSSNNSAHRTALAKLTRISRRLDLPGKEMLVSGYLLDEKPLDIKSLKDKIIIVQFWGTWCVPCREEMPILVDLYDKYHKKGLEIIGVNTAVKGDENPVKVRQFLETTKFSGKLIPWTILHETFPRTKKFNTMTDFYGIDELPQVMLIGKNGKVIALNPLPSSLDQQVAAALNTVLLDDLTKEEQQRYEETRRRQQEELDREIQKGLKK